MKERRRTLAGGPLPIYYIVQLRQYKLPSRKALTRQPRPREILYPYYIRAVL